jgi:predicted ABC-type transport system involved in lysophospholipase L1 biosynthesis ATPase subunit
VSAAKDGRTRARRGSVALSLRDVSVPPGRGRRAGGGLDGVSLDLCEGELTCVTGSPAGAASRLLAVAAGVEQPASGAVLTGGSIDRGLGDPRASQLRTGEAILISGAARRRGIRAALGRGRREGEPPGAAADRQLAALERALAARPLVLFADLDPPGQAECAAALAAWVARSGRTAVAAVSDPLAATAADRLLVISAGAIVADLGSPDRGELEELSLRLGG